MNFLTALVPYAALAALDALYLELEPPKYFAVLALLIATDVYSYAVAYRRGLTRGHVLTMGVLRSSIERFLKTN